MQGRNIETRNVIPLETPRTHIRFGSVICIGESRFLEIKVNDKKDYLTSKEAVELIEGKPVDDIRFKGDSPDR